MGGVFSHKQGSCVTTVWTLYTFAAKDRILGVDARGFASFYRTGPDMLPHNFCFNLDAKCCFLCSEFRKGAAKERCKCSPSKQVGEHLMSPWISRGGCQPDRLPCSYTFFCYKYLPIKVLPCLVPPNKFLLIFGFHCNWHILVLRHTPSRCQYLRHKVS